MEAVIKERILNLKNQREVAAQAVAQIQAQVNQALVKVHQLDGAISALEDLLKA